MCYVTGWYRGENRAMKFAITRIWRKPSDHSSNCYFWMVDPNKRRTGMNAPQIVYPDIPSYIITVPHCPELPVTTPRRTDLVKHEIKLTSDVPVKSRSYPTPFHLQQEIDKGIEIMIKNGIIERSDSAYAAPLVVIKKLDGSSRLCCNYKQLKKTPVFDPEPMMSNEDVFSKLSGSKFYTKFDFSEGYYQLPMDENSKDLTTFICAS